MKKPENPSKNSSIAVRKKAKTLKIKKNSAKQLLPLDFHPIISHINTFKSRPCAAISDFNQFQAGAGN
jgi:hypothetical protein